MGSLIKRTALAAAFVVGVSAPALAATCTEPVPPVIAVNGVTATVQQMKDAIGDFKTISQRRMISKAASASKFRRKRLPRKSRAVTSQSIRQFFRR